jgi:hypothetical protein
MRRVEDRGQLQVDGVTNHGSDASRAASNKGGRGDIAAELCVEQVCVSPAPRSL